jgi:hypothetical protein
MGEWLAGANGALVRKHTPLLPLRFFDDNELREGVAFELDAARAAAAALEAAAADPSDADAQAAAAETIANAPDPPPPAGSDAAQPAVALFTATSTTTPTALGEWRPCSVTQYDPQSDACEVVWVDDGAAELLHPMQVRPRKPTTMPGEGSVGRISACRGGVGPISACRARRGR